MNDIQKDVQQSFFYSEDDLILIEIVRFLSLNLAFNTDLTKFPNKRFHSSLLHLMRYFASELTTALAQSKLTQQCPTKML